MTKKSELNADDIKNMKFDGLRSLSEDIRAEIIRTIGTNGGHLSSNLGIVETTVALYRVFDFPKDKLIFDVGHQCYAHKILSDRRERFGTIRTDGGISGFPDRDESVYDAFTAGHAGTSLAAALGYCAARDLKGENYTVVGVVGDGALGNGLNLEALTASRTKPKNLIIILNDNGMSISLNSNGFYELISKKTAGRGYVRSKKAFKKVFGNSFVTKLATRFRNFIKRTISRNNYFEQYGFKYVGIVDGNDVKETVKMLERVKAAAKEKAVFLHIRTTKGKGHPEAEENPNVYHGVGANFVCDNGEFSCALGKSLVKMIEQDRSIMAITAAMKDGTGLCAVEKAYPGNFMDVGIAEEYAVTLAAGMAAGGARPVVAIYSTFLQRAYDEILHDVCLQNLPVVFCLDRAGLNGQDGKTHQGVFDLSYLGHIPNMRIIAPVSADETEDALRYAFSLNAPVAIRYPKNGIKINLPPIEEEPWAKICGDDEDRTVILAVGPRAASAAIKYCESDKNAGVIAARVVKPLCADTLIKIKDKKIITIEENSVYGGFGQAVRNFYADRKIKADVSVIGVPDGFVAHGSVDRQLKDAGICAEKIAECVKEKV